MLCSIAETKFEFCVNSITAATSLAAIWYAARESRRNNKAILQMRRSEFSGRQSLDENNQQFFHQYKLIVRNLGISLYNLNLSVDFANFAGYGRASVQLKLETLRENHDEFAKGMIAEFALKSYQLQQHEIAILKDLRDPAKQDARLCAYSQGYLAYQWPIGGAFERVKTNYAKCAAKVNFRLGTTVKSPDGVRSLHKSRDWMPIPQLIGSPLMDFIRTL